MGPEGPRNKSLSHERRPTHRIAALPCRLDPRTLQRPDAPHEGELGHRVPRLRRRYRLPLRQPCEKTVRHRERTGRIPVPGGLPDHAPLRAFGQGRRLEQPVLQFIRKHLYGSSALAAQHRASGLPAAGRGCRSGCEDLHHGERPSGLSGALPPQYGRRNDTHGPVRALPHQDPTRRIQRNPAHRPGTRSLHRPRRSSAFVPVARGRRRQRPPNRRIGFELAARRTLEDRRHLLDPPRQGRLGLVECLEPRGRRLPCRNQHRNL